MSKQAFHNLLKESGFLWKDYRSKFNLIEKDDIPFEAINRELVENEISDLEVERSYYVISSAWFEKWSFFYQGQTHMIDQNAIKSTKLMLRG